MPNQLFISDIHLSSTRPSTLTMWQRFLQTKPQAGDRLYILGDLCDVWVGDDDDAPLANQVREALRQLTERGVALFIQPGNRDFLLGKQFVRQVGATLLPDEYCVSVAGKQTLLLHGDLLCTNDHAYQKARKRWRNPIVQWLLLRKSLAARRKIAADYRQRSRANMLGRPLSEMDACEATVLHLMQRHQVTQMIHGHTHQPAVHQHVLWNGQTGWRCVLDEWHAEHASVWVDDGTSLSCERILCVGSTP